MDLPEMTAQLSTFIGNPRTVDINISVYTVPEKNRSSDIPKSE